MSLEKMMSTPWEVRHADEIWTSNGDHWVGVVENPEHPLDAELGAYICALHNRELREEHLKNAV